MYNKGLSLFYHVQTTKTVQPYALYCRQSYICLCMLQACTYSPDLSLFLLNYDLCSCRRRPGLSQQCLQYEKVITCSVVGLLEMNCKTASICRVIRWMVVSILAGLHLFCYFYFVCSYINIYSAVHVIQTPGDLPNLF